MSELNTQAPAPVADERLLGAQLFNETWRLMEKEGRTRADDDRMIHTAHASRYHWGQVPDVTPAHLARGEWQISRVYTVLERPEPALHHAQRVLDLCQENGIGDWDLAFAYEALARARAVAGNAELAREYTDQALAAAEDIADDEDVTWSSPTWRPSPASRATGSPRSALVPPIRCCPMLGRQPPRRPGRAPQLGVQGGGVPLTRRGA